MHAKNKAQCALLLKTQQENLHYPLQLQSLFVSLILTWWFLQRNNFTVNGRLPFSVHTL